MDDFAHSRPDDLRRPDAGPDAGREASRRVGHALRTPLTAILGFSHMLSGAPNLTPRQREAVAMIEQGGQQLLATIEHLQRNARIDWDPPPPVAASAPAPLTAVAPADPPGVVVAPPPDLRQRFEGVAQAGNMRLVMQFADELATRGLAHEPLAHELRRLAGRYETRALAALAARLREETSA